ncbi:hypothetical protein Y1Q_0006471 [Alligator mississippiensis]|uniref:Uncharacterized protein n=1 Tax=Alligator mississippiensis TaxID=8496 RepID=A0A151MVN6_ALLMI|nr:hypothetical protein Y1Q_0006471 [Alligator mississippiensis]
MQPAAMAPPDVQNFQALIEILNAQQQMIEWKQDWLQHGLTAFKMLKMTQEDEAYIEAFEWHAIMTGLDKGYWVSQLGALMVGKAQATYQALPQDKTRDYNQVKTTILYRLEINPEHYRWLFWAEKGPEEKRPQLLLQLLQDLFNERLSPASYDQDTSRSDTAGAVYQ